MLFESLASIHIRSFIEIRVADSSPKNMAAPNILYIINHLHIGGAEKQLCSLLRGLDRGKFNPKVVCFEPDGHLVNNLTQTGIPVYCCRRKFRYDPMLLWQLVRFIKRHRIDLIHSFLSLAGIYGSVAAFITGKSMVNSSIRGMHRQDLIHRTASLRLSFLLSDRIIANSKAGAQSYFKSPSKKLRVIYNGIDLKAYSKPHDHHKIKNRLGINSFDKIVSIIARIESIKDHQTFIKSAELIIREYPRTGFLVIGEGTIKSKLINYTEALGIYKNFKFLGLRYDIPQILSVTDIVVLTSISEGLPNSIIEAQVAGVPVISTDCGGVNEIVAHNHSGFILPVGDRKKIAEKIIYLIQNPAIADRMGQHGKRLIEKYFNLQTMVNQFSSVYTELLK